MSNTGGLSRAQLIHGLCLPLAVLLGFFLAAPTDPSTVAVVGLVLAVLVSPLLFQWHHLALATSWNAAVAPGFLPGSPYLWMLLAVPSLALGFVTRSTDPHRRFLSPPSVAISLLVLAAVALTTAALTGGIGVRSLGSERFGGRGYFYILFAIVGFFALTSQGIPRDRVGLYVGLFFLSGLTALAGNVIYALGPKAYPLFDIFPPTWAVGQAMAIERVDAPEGSARIGGFSQASVLLLCFLLARYGVRRLFDLTRPWRVVLFLAAAVGILYAGYRSALLLFLMTLAVVFVLEGLHRTRYMVLALVGSITVLLILLPVLPQMPYVIQRTLAVLPVQVSPAVREDVRGSTRWRLEMWQEVAREAPRYILLGKGYAIDPRELELTVEGTWRGRAARWATASLARDYHNGLLSLYVPLGGPGTMAFAWFLFAGGRVLRRNCREGAPEMQYVNRLLYGYFLARVLYFLFVFGSFFMDLAVFVGLVGLGLSLNAPLWQRKPVVGSLETGAQTVYSVWRETQSLSKSQ